MGRAIDMEKDISVLKVKIEKLENIVRGMSSSIGEMEGKSTKTKHIDLVDAVKDKEPDNGKEANDKGNSESDRADNKSSGNARGKTKKDRNSSK